MRTMMHWAALAAVFLLLLSGGAHALDLGSQVVVPENATTLSPAQVALAIHTLPASPALSPLQEATATVLALFAPNPRRKAQLYLSAADRRLAQAHALLAHNDSEGAIKALASYRDDVVQYQALAGNASVQGLAVHAAILAAIAENATPALRKAADEARSAVVAHGHGREAGNRSAVHVQGHVQEEGPVPNTNRSNASRPETGYGIEVTASVSGNRSGSAGDRYGVPENRTYPGEGNGSHHHSDITGPPPEHAVISGVGGGMPVPLNATTTTLPRNASPIIRGNDHAPVIELPPARDTGSAQSGHADDSGDAGSRHGQGDGGSLIRGLLS